MSNGSARSIMQFTYAATWPAKPWDFIFYSQIEAWWMPLLRQIHEPRTTGKISSRRESYPKSKTCSGRGCPFFGPFYVVLVQCTVLFTVGIVNHVQMQLNITVKNAFFPGSFGVFLNLGHFLKVKGLWGTLMFFFSGGVYTLFTHLYQLPRQLQ